MIPQVVQAVTAESENPLIPAIPDLVWGSVCFLIVLFFFWKYALPRVQKALDARAEQIEGSIEEAQQQKQQAQEALAQYTAQLAEARREAAQIRDQARAEGQQILAELRQQAQAEAQRITDTARAQIEADRQAAFTELKSEIGLLAVDLASSVVRESLTDDTRSQHVVDQFLADLDGAAK